MIKLCKACHDKTKKHIINPPFPICLYGYSASWISSCFECPCDECEHYQEVEDHSFTDIDISKEDYRIIMRTSNDMDFIDAMINLKQNDPIEYGIRMAQIRPAAELTEKHIQEEWSKKVEEKKNPKPKCPKCGSTNIQIVPRKWSLLTGFLTNKTDRVCVNCKHKF